MLYSALAAENFVEWKGKTKATPGHEFHWPDCCPGDISGSCLIRFSLKGVHDTYLAFAEEKEHNAKKITYLVGGWDNKASAVKWQKKGDSGNRGWHGQPQDPYSYSGQVHKGYE